MFVFFFWFDPQANINELFFFLRMHEHIPYFYRRYNKIYKIILSSKYKRTRRTQKKKTSLLSIHCEELQLPPRALCLGC
jgi:hypothetical protein